mmetsp:Transcript_7766/g.17714  ORF Transcript_7766/g.17714 Transcript_7766/m.17714 type:complete len:308 (-) Transcript_7766:54-977(-)|eukprot:CAMPEP_0206129788 /NCGR_PEP_ID=MMETSP1472-20131121/37767_1 /ASSEMBLY_ACC=CAM_ASM_001108 /TAXON_ID=41880 /ORGANISM="Pycnococcus provasolii, Strain RCC251" /LENGTH=307 /DNA_ID=CAMNT_0053521075 /DNA_START=109 /DNA_END=1032 /DNA_ORIENTATION=-
MVVSGHVHYHTHAPSDSSSESDSSSSGGGNGNGGNGNGGSQSLILLSALSAVVGGLLVWSGLVVGAGRTGPGLRRLPSLGRKSRSDSFAHKNHKNGNALGRDESDENKKQETAPSSAASQAQEEVQKLKETREHSNMLSKEAMRLAAAEARLVATKLTENRDVAVDAGSSGIGEMASARLSLDELVDAEALDAAVQAPLAAMEAELDAHKNAREALDSERRVLLREQEVLTRALQVAQRNFDEVEANLWEATQERDSLRRRYDAARARLTTGTSTTPQLDAEGVQSAHVEPVPATSLNNASTPSYIS